MRRLPYSNGDGREMKYALPDISVIRCYEDCMQASNAMDTVELGWNHENNSARPLRDARFFCWNGITIYERGE